MTTTPNLGITHVRSASVQPEVVVNAALDSFDAALTEKFAVIFDANPTTLSATQYDEHFAFDVQDGAASPTLAGPYTLYVPPTKRGLFAVINSSSYDVTVTVQGQSLLAPAVPAGLSGILYSDGTNVRSVSASTIDIGGFQSGVATSGDIIFEYIFTSDTTFLAGFPGSYAKSSTNSTLQADVTIEQNGTQIGRARFLAGTSTGVFSLTSNTRFAPGDVMTVRMPNPADATLAGVRITLHGIRA